MQWIYKMWTEIGYAEGFILTLWLVGLYWGKKRLDYHFARKTSKVVYNVKIVPDSHISVDHAHIEQIDDIHGDLTTHPRKY